MKLEILNEKEFDEFSINQNNTSFTQNSSWAKLKNKYNWNYYYLGYKNNNKIICATLLLSKKIINKMYMFYAPHGYLIDYNDKVLFNNFDKDIREFVKKNNGFTLKIDPYILLKERDKNGNIVENGINNEKLYENLIKIGYKENKKKTLQPKWISILELENLNENNLLNTFDNQRRNRIKKTIDTGFELIELKKEELSEFKKITQHTSERRNFVDRPLSYYENIYDEFVANKRAKFYAVKLNFKKYINNLTKKENTILNNIKELNKKEKTANNITKINKQIFELKKEQESIRKKIDEANNFYKTDGEEVIISAALFMTFGNEYVYLTSGTYKKYMNFYAQYYMQYMLIKEAIKNKNKRYNFYGISGNFDEKSNRFGVFDFKRGFNAVVWELLGEFDYTINPIKNIIFKIGLYGYKFFKKIKRCYYEKK